MLVKGTYNAGEQNRPSSGVSRPTPVALVHPHVPYLLIAESRKKKLFG